MSLLDEILTRYKALPPDVQEQVKKDALAATAHMKWVPNPGPQTDAYFSPADLLYYGGSAGSGKSQLLLGLAINEHRVSRLFRRQFKDIDGEGGLVPALAKILGSTAGYRGDKHVWTIPGKGPRRTVEFAAFETPKEAEAYQGRAADLFGFDEVVQFQEQIVRFITAWNRTTIENQRCRVVFASNPPTTPEGLWVLDWFAPWLDERHPRPAKPGELRWYTQIDGVETEVGQDYENEIVDSQGNVVLVRAKSRTFIPGSLSDNPDLLESGYASTLANLPKHLQDALLGGKFKTTLEDAERQVIPAEWVLKAQERWALRKGDLIKKPMTAVGCDVADGGRDRMVVTPLHVTTFGEPHIVPGAEVKSTPEKASAILLIAKDDPQINIDCGGGYGGGVADMLESNNFNVVRCKGAMRSTATDRDRVRGFANKRAEWIWRFREALDPDRGDEIALPPGREILMELCAFREKPHADMRTVIQIEDNDEITKRIGRSPDIAWSFFFAWAEPDGVLKKERAVHTRRRSAPGRQPQIILGHAKSKRPPPRR